MTTNQILGATLAVQAALAVVTWWPSADGPVEATPLVPGGGNAIAELTVTPQGADEGVWLQASDGTWTVQSAFGHPADPDKVAEVVDALGKIELGRPIATSAVSHEALKVSADTHDKEIVVRTEDGEEITVLVGAAASKAIHVRRADGDDVWKVKGLSSWSIKDDAKSYLPTNAVSFDKEAVETFALTNPNGRIGFVKDGETWRVEGDDTVVGKADAVADLIDKASKLRLASIVAGSATGAHGLGHTTVDWSVAEEGQTIPGSFTVGAEVDGGYAVQVDGEPYVLASPAYRLDPLRDAVPADLVEPAPPSAAPDTEE